MRLQQKIVFLSVLLFVIFLSGCGFKPAYRALSSEEKEVMAFTTLEVAPQSTLLGQKIRNHLLSAHADDQLKTPHYRLVFEPQSMEEASIQVFDTSTLRKRYKLEVAFTLIDLKTHKERLKDHVFSMVSYDRVNAPFANSQALLAAEDRASEEIALGIRAKILAYFASNHKK